MPVRRTLQMNDAYHPPTSKIPVRLRAKSHAPSTGTATPKAGKTKVPTRQQALPRPELVELESLRSKLEKSVDSFIKARKELEEILPADGSSEQARFSTRASSGLKTELKRHRELTSRVESSLKANKDPKHPSQGIVKYGSSYEFLKSIVG